MPTNAAAKKAARAFAAEAGLSYTDARRRLVDPTAVVRSVLRDVAVDDQIRFVPDQVDWWWTVRARDDRFVVATRQQPFALKGTIVYTVVDLSGWNRTYNGVGPGVVRSSLNTLGGGWDLGPNGEGCSEILAGLTSGRWELSNRRVMTVNSVEVR